MTGLIILRNSTLRFAAGRATAVRQFSSAHCLFSEATSEATEEVRESKKRVPSIALPGTRLRGCNIRAKQEDPVALPDEEYPDWLWDILDEEAQQKKLDADPEKKARKEWRKKAREAIKTRNFLKTM
ncbi:mitochondrial ribosomal protein L37-domain-containing protein [Lipomyces japonicus]|uniref:mitochondrial 54S ribosomal protein mL54 n=1 Tax=Lipomyces japonicus TaxID=56871 RepID=UPI0034CEB38A